MAIILQGKVHEYDGTIDNVMMFAGYSLFWTGISVGFSNLFCGYFSIMMSEFVWEYQAVDAQLQMHKIHNPLSKFSLLKSLAVHSDSLESLLGSFNVVMATSPKIDPTPISLSIQSITFILLSSPHPQHFSIPF